MVIARKSQKSPITDKNSEEFASAESYHQFQRSVLFGLRFMHDQETIAFLNAVLATCATREEHIPANTVLWRAQRGHELAPIDPEYPEAGDMPVQYGPERMKPRTLQATEGRANPKGLPCFYAATDAETAIGEVRPWVGSEVSVGRFNAVRDLKIVNVGAGIEPGANRKFYLRLSNDAPMPHVSREQKEANVWWDIDHAFSTPVTECDDEAHYVPTQILAELFRAHGYDGVKFRSSVGPGYSFALFDLNSVTQLTGHLYEVKKIKVEFAEIWNTYFVTPT